MLSSVVETMDDGRARERRKALKGFHNSLQLSLEKMVGGKISLRKRNNLRILHKHHPWKENNKMKEMSRVWHLVHGGE